MEKLILRKIAQDWCKSILLANECTSFDDGLSQEEIDYVVAESHKIAERITKRPAIFTTPQIVERYYDFEPCVGKS